MVINWLLYRRMIELLSN